MNQQPENPFASPDTGQSQKPRRRGYRDLIPLWIWLGVAVIGSVGFTPSDPISMMAVLAASLVLLWAGLGLVANRHWAIRLLLIVFVVIPSAIPLTTLMMIPFTISTTLFPWLGLAYMAINLSLACYAISRLGTRRLKVITYFSIGFGLGSFGMCLGTIAGSVTGTLLAVRQNKSPPEFADESQDDAQADSPH